MPLFFPQELHEAIIDHLHDDRPALIACSLILRQWVYPSRYHTFSKVYLHPQNVEAFLDLLKSPLCTIRPFVSHLAVQQAPSEFAYDRYDLWFNDGISRLSGFSSLRVLHLLGLGRHRRGNITNALKIALRENFNAVVDLEINKGVFQSTSHFAAVMNAFPVVSRLVLETIAVEQNDCSLPVQLHPPLRHLKTLVFKSSYTIQILRWLLSHDHLPPISTFHLDIGSNTQPADSVFFNDFLKRLGPSLQQFHFSEEQHLGSMQPIVDNLSHNTNLRSLHIHRHLTFQRTDWIISLISTINSPLFDAFALGTTSTCYLDSNLCDKLETLFSRRPQFAGLQKIELCIPNPLSGDIDAIRAKFPTCDKRGLIRFSIPVTAAATPFADYLNPVVNTPPVVIPWMAHPSRTYPSFMLLMVYFCVTAVRYIFSLFFWMIFG